MDKNEVEKLAQQLFIRAWGMRVHSDDDKLAQQALTGAETFLKASEAYRLR